MAKQIIILKTNPQDGGRKSITYVAWFAVSAGREVPLATGISAYSGASDPEKMALQAGTVLEEVRNLSIPSSFTTTETKAALVKDYTDRKTYLDAQPAQLTFFGVFYDGSVWSS